MPLLRYKIQNEYSLANQDLWQAALKDEPEGIAEGVAMAGLVGIVRQLGDMAEFAAELFHQLHEEVMSTAARGHGLLARVQQLETELPTFEKMLASQTKELQLVYTQGLEWHATVHNNQNHLIQGDLPRFIRNSYEQCRGPPMLFLLDKFDGDGDGACLKRYTDPSFFKQEWASSELSRAKKHLQDRKTQRIRRKGRRHTTGGALPEAINVSQMKPRVPYTLLEVTKPVFNEDHVKANKEVKDDADANGSCSDASIHGPRDENDIKAYWEAEVVGLSDNSTNGEANIVPIDDMDEVFNKNEFSNTEKRGGFSDRNETVKDAELEEPRYIEIIEEQEKFEDALVTIDSEIETDFESIANKLDMDSEAFLDDDVEWYSDAREGEGSLFSDTKGDAFIKSRHATLGLPILSQPSFNAEEDLISIQPHVEALEPFEIKERKMTLSLCLSTDGSSSSDGSSVNALHQKSKQMRSSPRLSIYENENEDGSEEGEEDVLDDSDNLASVYHVSESLSSSDMGQKEDCLSSLFHLLPEPAIPILNSSDLQRIPDLGALSLHKRDPEALERDFLSMEKNGNQEETLLQDSSSDSFDKPIPSMMQDHCIDDDDEELGALSLHKRDSEPSGRDSLSMEKNGNQEETLSQASSSDSFNKPILSMMQDHCIDDDNDDDDDDDDDEDRGILSLQKQDLEASGRYSLSMEKNGNQEETLSQASSLDSFDKPILSTMQDHCIDDDGDNDDDDDDDYDYDDDDDDDEDEDEDDDIDVHQATSESSSSSSLMLPSPHNRRTNLLPNVLSPPLESTLTRNHSRNFEVDCIGDVVEECHPISESSLNEQSPKESPPLPPLPPLKWRSMKSCISTHSLSPCDNSISPSKDLLTPPFPPPPSQPQSVRQQPIAPVIERANSLLDENTSYDRNVLQSFPRQPIVPVIKRADSLVDDITSYDRNALKKVVKQISLPQQKPSDDRESLLEQIRTRSFNLRRTVVEKHEAPRTVPNINVAAILEKANAIRQAFAGSDDEDVDDDWNDD